MKHPHTSAPRVYLHSKHPFVLQMIRKVVSADQSVDFVGLVSTVGATAKSDVSRILLIDACSTNEWREFARRWQAAGGRTMLLVASSVAAREIELEIVYLGVHGVLPLSADIDTKLMPAIHSVAQDKLWMSDETVDKLVRQARALSGPLAVDGFTVREHQVLTLLLKGFPNKQIAQTLSISERTIKFHVSNILRKENVDTRRDLIVKANNGACGGKCSSVPSDTASQPSLGEEGTRLRVKACGA